MNNNINSISYSILFGLIITYLITIILLILLWIICSTIHLELTKGREKTYYLPYTSDSCYGFLSYLGVFTIVPDTHHQILKGSPSEN